MKNIRLSIYDNALADFHIKRAGDFPLARLPHLHDYFQVYYADSGSVEHCLAGSGAVLRRGDFSIIPPLTEHQIGRIDGVRLYSVSFARSFLPAEFDTGPARDYLHGLRAGPVPARITPPPDLSERMRALCAAMLAEFEGQALGYVPALKAYLSALLILIARSTAQRGNAAPPPDPDSGAILRCVDRLKANLALDSGIEQEARLCQMSRARFCRAFRAVTGSSFAQYKTGLRVESALALLRSGGRSLQEISLMCGFAEYSSFYRSFVARVGVSPSQYRRLGGLTGGSPPD